MSPICGLQMLIICVNSALDPGFLIPIDNNTTHNTTSNTAHNNTHNTTHNCRAQAATDRVRLSLNGIINGHQKGIADEWIGGCFASCIALCPDWSQSVFVLCHALLCVLIGHSRWLFCVMFCSLS